MWISKMLLDLNPDVPKDREVLLTCKDSTAFGCQVTPSLLQDEIILFYCHTVISLTDALMGIIIRWNSGKVLMDWCCQPGEVKMEFGCLPPQLKAWWNSYILLVLQNCIRALISSGNMVHQAGARAEKDMALVEVKSDIFQIGEHQKMLVCGVQSSTGIRHCELALVLNCC